MLLGMAPAIDKGRVIALKTVPTYLLHSDLNVSIRLLSMEILGPVKERKKSLSKDADCFSPFSQRSYYPPEVHIQTHSLPNCSHLPPWLLHFLTIYTYRVGEGEEHWMGGRETQVLVLPSYLTFWSLFYPL